MTSETTPESAPIRSRFRFRFRLLALLLLITLLCIGLGWWKFVYLERQRFILRRQLLAQRVQDLSRELKWKIEDYLDIVKGMGSLEGDGQKDLQQFDLKRLDRIDEELMRLERELWELQAKKATTGTDYHKPRIAQLRKEQQQLKEEIERRGQRSTDLEIRRAELERIQQMINEYWRELEKLNIEAEVRGILSK